MPETIPQLEFAPPPPSHGWNKSFFIIAGLAAVVVMEFFENDLTALLWTGLVAALAFIIAAAILYRKGKIDRATYLSAAGIPELFVAFTFLNPFIGNTLLGQAVIIGAGLLIATIPQTRDLFLAESISLALIAATLFRFIAIFGISWLVVVGIFLIIAAVISALVFARLERHLEHLKRSWPVLFMITIELFVVLLILPINIWTRAVLLGSTFYFYFKAIMAKDKAVDMMQVVRLDAIFLGLLYLALLLSVHWM